MSGQYLKIPGVHFRGVFSDKETGRKLQSSPFLYLGIFIYEEIRYKEDAPVMFMEDGSMENDFQELIGTDRVV